MGIRGLWKLLAPIATVQNLRDLSTIEGFERNVGGKRALVIGIDTDTLMSKYSAMVYKKSFHGHSPLRLLFYYLCFLLRYPITCVFVFDGPLRPAKKRGRTVVSRTPPWVDPAKRMIEAFGFYAHQAPGEGEAELAKMNTRGFIDAVLTTDSDVFVFGARDVIRSINATECPRETVVLYNSTAIEKEPELEVTHAGLVLIALLCKSDYSDGIEGIGEQIALGLVQAGLGISLSVAFDVFNEHDFDRYTRNVFIPLLKAELRLNSHECLKRCYPALAESIPDNAIDRRIMELFLEPVTSWSPGQIRPLTMDFSPRLPDFRAVTLCCYNELGWVQPPELFKTIRDHIWEGLVLQMYLSSGSTFNQSSHVLSAGPLQVVIRSSTLKARQTDHKYNIGKWLRIDIDGSALHKMALEAVLRASSNTLTPLSRSDFSTDIADLDKLLIWVPEAYTTINQTPSRSKSTSNSKPHSKKRGKTTACVDFIDLSEDVAPPSAVESSSIKRRKTTCIEFIDLSNSENHAESSSMAAQRNTALEGTSREAAIIIDSDTPSVISLTDSDEAPFIDLDDDIVSIASYTDYADVL